MLKMMAETEDRDKSGPKWDFQVSESDDHANNETAAVAISYDPDSAYAPKVVAGGRGAIAEQILQIAFANDVKVRQDADLVQLLSAIDIDSEIPVEAFAAVAEILTYVYRANGRMMPPAGEDADSQPGP